MDKYAKFKVKSVPEDLDVDQNREETFLGYQSKDEQEAATKSQSPERKAGSYCYKKPSPIQN